MLRTFGLADVCEYFKAASARQAKADLRTFLPNKENSSIIPSNINLDTARHAPQALPTPHINNSIRRIPLQLRNLSILGAHRHLLSRRVEQRDNRAVARRARPVHGGVGAVEGVVRVDAPLVGPGGLADDRVLVEGEEVLVLQDGDLFLGQLCEVGAHEKRAFHYCPEREVRVFLLDREAVADLLRLVSLGDVRTWVEGEMLTSSMSGSLRPQKSV
jgi:hypothetical protein